MESYPQHLQLQKNVLLTICTDRILQDVSFDRYRCSRLVLNCLCSYDEESMKRMSVAIISILAARISTQVRRALFPLTWLQYFLVVLAELFSLEIQAFTLSKSLSRSCA